MKIYLFHANAGQGHKKVAEVIQSEFARRTQSDLSVFLEDALDSTPGYFKAAYPAIYFYSVKYTPGAWGFSYETLDTPLGSALIHPIRTFGNRLVGNRLLKRIISEAPDYIICTHFFTAELFSRAKQEGLITAKIIIVITDFFPHSFWVNKGTDYYWVMSDEGKDDLLRRGVQEEQIRVGGIPVENVFLPQGNRSAILSKLNFSEGKFTILLTSGSFGLGPTEEILKQMNVTKFKDKIQVFVVCGHNKDLKEKLDRQHFDYPVQVFGFIDFMHELMEAGDLMIAKSGGSTTSESLAKGLPMVILKPIPGQETRNAELLRRRDASFFIETSNEIVPILNDLFKDRELLSQKREAIHLLAKPDAARDLVDFCLSS